MSSTSPTTPNMGYKVIVIGHVDGQLSDLFEKLTKLHSKNSFAFAIVAGNLFADPETASEEQQQELAKLLSGSISVPLSTHFALGPRALPNSVVERLSSNQGELCPNLFVLGRKALIKTSQRMRIVAIGGSYVSDVDNVMDEYAPIYTDKDVEATKAFKEADILVTTDWPENIQLGSTSYAGEPPKTEESISELCSTLRPRYHFSASEAFYERAPFFHMGPPPLIVTRFISLAPLNNPQKMKAMFAFTLQPSSPGLDRPPTGSTISPFIVSKKRKGEGEEENGNGYRFSNDNPNEYQDRHFRPKKRARRPQPTQQECFFCLGGRADNGGTHLITTIGEDVYMTVAKGPLSTRGTFAGLNHPLHMLIIPIPHAPTVSAMPEGLRKPVVSEVHRLREALHSMVAVKSTSGDSGEAKLGSVTWEISRGSGVHIHWQFLPVPINLVKGGLIEKAFDVEAHDSSYPKFAKTAEDMAEAEEGDYFKVMIWSESMQKEIVLPLDKGFRFDLQFGRRVLGKLLALEPRTHWKDCVQPEAEEVQDCQDFQKMFERYDPTAEESAAV